MLRDVLVGAMVGALLMVAAVALLLLGLTAVTAVVGAAPEPIRNVLAIAALGAIVGACTSVFWTDD